MCLLAQPLLQCLSNSDTAAYHDNIDIIGGTFQKDVSHISTYHITLNTHLIGRITNEVEYLFVKYLC